MGQPGTWYGGPRHTQRRCAKAITQGGWRGFAALSGPGTVRARIRNGMWRWFDVTIPLGLTTPEIRQHIAVVLELKGFNHG